MCCAHVLIAFFSNTLHTDMIVHVDVNMKCCEINLKYYCATAIEIIEVN